MLLRKYKYISMDEIFITRTPEGESVYYWVLNNISDPRKVETIRIDSGRLKTDVIKRLGELGHQETIEAVAGDMWEPYQDAVMETLPHALYVVDPFHVIQVSEKAVEDIRKQQSRLLPEKERKELKKDAKLFGENLLSLDQNEMDTLEKWFKKLPLLEEAYFLGQMLREAYKLKDVDLALEYLANWETHVIESGIQQLIKVLGTIQRWLPWILNFFIHRISNGKTEGRNNVIRAIERQGFHYKIPSLEGRILVRDQRRNRERWINRQKKLNTKSVS